MDIDTPPPLIWQTEPTGWRARRAAKVARRRAELDGLTRGEKVARAWIALILCTLAWPPVAAAIAAPGIAYLVLRVTWTALRWIGRNPVRFLKAVAWTLAVTAGLALAALVAAVLLGLGAIYIGLYLVGEMLGIVRRWT